MSEMVKMKLHILLDKYRISQRELSMRTGIRYATINNYTNNTHTYISNEHMDKLCNFFGCTISDLIEFTKDTPK